MCPRPVPPLMPLPTILHEDDTLVAFDKPSGLLVAPDRWDKQREIWRARDQKWYFEEAKGHIDAQAVECHECRTNKRAK